MASPSPSAGNRNLENSIRLDRRAAFSVPPRPAANPGEDEEVEKVHSAQSQQHPAQLVRQQLNGSARRGDLRVTPEGQGDKADIDEIEAHNQKMVDRSSQFDIAVKGIHQEDGAALVQGARNPNCQSNADEQIQDVSNNDHDVLAHKVLRSPRTLNTFKIQERNLLCQAKN